MDVSKIIKTVEAETDGAVAFYVSSRTKAFEEVSRMSGTVACNESDFFKLSKQIEEWQALLLLSATFHKSLAYSSEIMEIEKARTLAEEFLDSLDDSARYFSNCFCDDDVNGIGSWNPVTNHTFESVLYCETQNSSILMVCIDED